MEKLGINILIIEDDEAVGKSLLAALTQWGYSPEWLPNSNDVDSLIKLKDIHLAIIDSMLPKVSGVDLSNKIKESSGGVTKTILMSGIFKDRSFMQDAIKKTGALDYLTKPIDLNHLRGLLEKQFSDMIDEPKQPLQDLFTKLSLDNPSKLSAINSGGEIHGFELPWVYALLVNSNLSGTLSLKPNTGSEWKIRFDKGEIFRIENTDVKSYFGNLIVQHGYISKLEMDEVLNVDSNKRLGQRLVEANSISPHVIKIIQTEQLNIRLSQSIQDEMYLVNFNIDDISIRDSDDATIRSHQLSHFMNDLVMSKIATDWLKTLFNSWLDFCLDKGDHFDRLKNILSMPLFDGLSKIEKIINGKSSLYDVFNVNPKMESALVKALYYLLIERVVVFKKAGKSSNVQYEVKTKRLEKILEDMSHQSYYEMIGVSPKASINSINKAYQEMAKVLHPDKLPSDAPQNIKGLTSKVFTQLTEAYGTLKDPVKRATYDKELEHGNAENILEAERIFESAMNSLQSRRYLEAFKVFESLLNGPYTPPDTSLCFVWAQIKSKQVTPRDHDKLERIHLIINSIAPEDRHSALYFYVKGLTMTLTEKYDRALSSFESALATDPQFLPAKRDELRIKRLINEKAKKITAKSILVDFDVGQAVTSLFKRKK